VHFRWARSSVSVFATLAIALIAVGLQLSSVAIASSTQTASYTGLIASRTTAFPWKGQDPSCEVRLPIPGFVSYGRFTTCPPKRVLLLGDSLALTIGIQMSLDEADWGTIVDNAGVDGCGFVTGYNVEFLKGRFTPLPAYCNTEAAGWISEIRSFKPQAIVVEKGWWDSFPHMIKGNVSFLTQPRYDALVKQQILGLIHSLRTVSAAPIYFLSVPWMQPNGLQSGEPEPAASAAFHNEINRLIRSATQSATATHFVDISPYITPAGHFQSDVGDDICRTSDGIHLYYSPGNLHYVHTKCGKALQQGVLSLIRQGLAKH
jgi:hypothetical protein